MILPGLLNAGDDRRAVTGLLSGVADYASENPLDAAATATMFTPVVGDVTGLLADAKMYATEPEQRNLLNYALTAASVLPVIPAASVLKKNIDAFHGSPYDFDEFDLSRVGSGEGATMYGHGLYFSDTENVADFFRGSNTEVPFDYSVDGQSVSSLYNSAERSGDYELMSVLEDIQMHSTPKSLKETYTVDGGYSKDVEDFVKSIDYDSLKGVDADGNEIPLGRTYKVQLDVIEDNLLDYQTKLSDQNPEISQKISKILGEDVSGQTGANAYFLLSEKLGGQEAASNALNNAGIKGIKYLDMSQGSRMDEAPKNYVVFDNSLVKILEKYGVVGTIGAGGLLSYQRQNNGDL